MGRHRDLDWLIGRRVVDQSFLLSPGTGLVLSFLPWAKSHLSLLPMLFLLPMYKSPSPLFLRHCSRIKQYQWMMS